MGRFCLNPKLLLSAASSERVVVDGIRGEQSGPGAGGSHGAGEELGEGAAVGVGVIVGEEGGDEGHRERKR